MTGVNCHRLYRSSYEVLNQKSNYKNDYFVYTFYTNLFSTLMLGDTDIFVLLFTLLLLCLILAYIIV